MNKLLLSATFAGVMAAAVLPDSEEIAAKENDLGKAHPGSEVQETNTTEQLEIARSFLTNCACPKASDVAVDVASGNIDDSFSMVQISIVEPVV